MDNFSFSGLSLKGINAAAASAVLQPGQYVCKVVQVKLTDTKDSKGKMLVVTLRDVKDKGVITDRLNISNPSAEATKIGLEQLKALLTHGGHPDPDNIGQHGVDSIKGLTVGIVVGSETYQGDKRSKVTGYMPVANVRGYEEQATGDAPLIGASTNPF